MRRQIRFGVGNKAAQADERVNDGRPQGGAARWSPARLANDPGPLQLHFRILQNLDNIPSVS